VLGGILEQVEQELLGEHRIDLDAELGIDVNRDVAAGERSLGASKRRADDLLDRDPLALDVGSRLGL